ncbi:amidohydrolase family protein, partial [Bacteroidota bacterium]
MANKLSRRQFVKNSAKGAAFIGLGGYNLLIQGCSKSAEYDLLITGGIVYDGMGSEGREVDIAVKGDKIIHIGEKMNQKRASIIVNAKGLAVSPGFIDAHTHTDIGLLVNPKAESYIRQGITTDISGNCGSSPFPVSDASYEEEAPVLKEKYGIDMDWRDIKGFFNRIEEKGSALNYASLVGQGDIRGKVVGLNDQEPTAEEIIEMRQLVAENMSDGALGLSTGLEYPPGSYAKTDELIELCSEVARFNGVYATHVRNEADGLLESIDEAITIARKTGVSLQISHLKVACPKNWGNIEKLI